MTAIKPNIPGAKIPFKSQSNGVFDDFHNKHNSLASKGHEAKNHGTKEDPLLKYPTRALAYTNEVGEALRPAISGAANLFWVPALMYFGADIWDKYKRGEDGDYSKESGKTAVRQTVFQAAASVFGPTYSIHAAQHLAMNKGGDKKVNKFYDKLILSKQAQAAGKEAPKHWVQKIPLVGQKMFDNFTNEKALNAPESNKHDRLMKKFAKTGNENLKKKAEKALHKAQHEFKELKINTKGKSAISNVFKTGVGFATLAAVAIPIDMLTEHLLIKKVVNPALGLRDHGE